MKPLPTGFIAKREVEYIKLLLSHAEPRGKEAGLERLCAHYRAGRLLRDSHDICQTLPGLLYDGDANVRRWAFNAIALVGNKEQNLDATVDALNRNRDNGDVLAAGIAALASLTDPHSAEVEIKRAGMEVDGGVLLAASQYSRSFYDRLSGVIIDPDRAGPTEVRLAIVLVGTGKAPENLFSRKHPNSSVLGSLHAHDDKQVAQYAAWAAWENPNLGIHHLGFAPAQIRDQVSDVRKYAARLLGKDDASIEEFYKLIDEISHDAEAKVREGLASGMLGSYFVGLEGMTARWYTREVDRGARDALVEHFISNAERCALYKGVALEEYKAAPQGSIIRAKMEARAEGLDLYREFKKIDLQASTLELFGESGGGSRSSTVTNNTTNNTTYNVTSQNIGVVGEANTVGGNINQTAHQASEQAKELLGALIALIDEQEEGGALSEGRELAEVARGEPSKGLLEKVVGWMEGVSAASTAAVATSTSFMTILQGLQAVLPQLGVG